MISGGQWLQESREGDRIPSDGVVYRYQVDAAAGGAYQVWLRLGFEWVRSDASYRIDGGAWQSIPRTQTTTNVVELGVWSEAAWAKGPGVDLKPGTQTLEVRFTKPEGDNRILYGFDCICLVPAAAAWTPDNILKPGEFYDAPQDREASVKVYQLPEAAAGGRPVKADLTGLWQAARFDDPDMDQGTYEPVSALPDGRAGLHWRGVQVPSDAWQRPDLSFGHRLVYRTKVMVPASHQGRSFHVEFGGHAWMTSVFVNGQLAGSHTGTLTPFSIDVTRHIKPGTENVIEAAIKGSYYAIDSKPGEMDRSRNQPRTEEFLKYLKWIDCTWPTGKGGGDSIQLGITRPASLVSRGAVHTADVFVQPKVGAMRMDASVTLANSTAAPQSGALALEAVNAATGEVERTFAPIPFTVGAGAAAEVKLSEPWPTAKLWWPAESLADKPVCYLLRATVQLDGSPADVHETLFGFRELGLDGRHVTLNGIRWRIHAWNSVTPSFLGAVKTPESYFKWNDMGVRMEGGVHTDFYDRNGIPGRLSMTWEGMFGQVAMNNPLMWENWKRHVRQMVVAYRNSPSVFHWSTGNEVMMITGRLFFNGDMGRHEQLLMEVFNEAKKLDPTRTISEDGAGDLGGLADSNNWHYVTGEYKIPHQFYEYQLGPAEQPRGGQDMNVIYRWDGKRPLVQGEEMYFDGMGNMAWFGGPMVYRGVEQRRQAGAKYGRMYTEGARWQDVFQINPCTGPLAGIEPSMARRAVYVKEYNAAHFPGTTVKRTIKVFNDTRRDEKLTLQWRLMVGGKAAAQGTKEYSLKAGLNQEDTLLIKTPAVSGSRGRGTLELTLLSGGAKVFTDAKPFDILPVLPPPAFRSGELAVWDPSGQTAGWLASAKTPFVRASLDAVAPAARTILIGPGAVTEENRAAVGAKVKEWSAAGRTVIVLEQPAPLREGDLPVPGILVADRERGKAARPEWERVGGHSGAIAHPMAPAHPVLKDLDPDDFFTWAGDDQLAYKLSHATPLTGSINLIQAGEDLSLAPLFELPGARGSVLISQMLIGEKLAQEPAAQRLLQNALNWAAARATAKPKKTLVFPAGDAAFAEKVNALGIDVQPAPSPLAALAAGVDVAVVRATPAALTELAANLPAVRAFAERGGWLMLAGLDEQGLSAFNRLVGVEHRLRPFRHEQALVNAMTDPLMMGISDRDLQQWDPEVIAPWMGLQRVSAKVFSSVVDAGDEAASFAQLGSFREGADRPLTDGLMNNTFWRYTQYVQADGSEPVTFAFAKPEPLAALQIWQSSAYLWAKEVELIVNGKSIKTVTLEAKEGWQSIALPQDAPVKDLTLRLKSTYPPVRQNQGSLVTFDEVRLIRRLPAGWAAKVVPLTSPGGLVKYPIGKGGVVLNQLRWDADDLPDNIAKKKIIFSSLMRNMGSTFKE